MSRAFPGSILLGVVALSILACSGRSTTQQSDYDVIDIGAGASLPDSLLRDVGCTVAVQEDAVPARLVLSVATAAGEMRRFACAGGNADSLRAALDAYWSRGTGVRRSWASMTVGQWWDLEFPVDLTPPTGSGQWIPASPTWREQGDGPFPEWTSEYSCEAIVWSDWYMVKCWSWEEGEGGGGGWEDPPGETLAIECNATTVLRGADVSCTASVSGGSMDSLVWSFEPDSVLGLATLPNVGNAATLTGPLAVGGKLSVKATGLAKVTQQLTVTPRTFAWGTQGAAGTAGNCFPWDGAEVAWGWAVPHLTCNMKQAFWPDPDEASTGSGVSTFAIGNGPNKGYAYVTAMSYRLYSDYAIVAELTGGGASYPVGVDDSVAFSPRGCFNRSLTFTFDSLNVCMGEKPDLVGFKNAAIAHEQAHVSCNATHQSAGRAATAPAQIEATVKSTAGAIVTAVNQLVRDAGHDVVAAVALTLHASGGDPYYFWWYTSVNGHWTQGQTVRTAC